MEGYASEVLESSGKPRYGQGEIGLEDVLMR
jgi:formylmethanofuran dehydrogenase subunit B